MESKQSYRSGTILSNEQISKDIFCMKVHGGFQGQPGQFYMVKAWSESPLLPRPLSICDLTDKCITFLYAVVGRGTGILSKFHQGDSISLLGPLGNGFPIDDSMKKVALVSGGIGIAPMLYLARNHPADVDIYAGFRSQIFFIDQIKPYVKNIFLATNDGSQGRKGYITEILSKDDYQAIYCCGPNPMMGAIQSLNLGIPTYLSLESHMACGIGACLGCSVKTTRGVLRVCHDGPVFEASEVLLHA